MKKSMMQNTISRSLRILSKVCFVLPLAMLLVTSCGPKKKVENNTILVSIEPLRYVTEYLVGGNFNVESITPREATPETYAPTVQQIKAIDECLAFVRVGSLGFENTQIRKVTDNSPHLYIINAAANTKKLPMCDHDHGDEHHGGEDPHIWMSPRNMKIIALNVYKQLCYLDQKNAEAYKERLLKFSNEMNELDSLTHEKLDTCKNKAFLINHPALGHYACQYNLIQISMEHDGKEPSPKQLEAVLERCRTHGVKKIFAQEQHSDKGVKRVAEELGVEVHYINPLSYNWKEEVERITQILIE